MQPCRGSIGYQVGDILVDVTAFRVLRGARSLQIQPKAFDVLVYLAERPGELVTKQDLIASVWNGISITDNALARVIAHLRRVLDDPVDQPRYIETVPTRGYRLIAPVATPHDEAVAMGEQESAAVAKLQGAERRSAPALRTAFVVAAVAIVVLAGATEVGRWQQVGPESTRASSAAGTPAVAVLPFRNLSGDPGQQYVADGVTEALTHALSRLTELPVSSWTAASRYRDVALTPQQIGRELSVQTLIEGAVVQTANRLRVSVAVVDVASGRRSWARTYESATDDVLAMYDEIASTAAGEFDVIARAPAPDRHARVDPGAYDHYLRAMYLLGNRWIAGGCREAEGHLHETISRAPDFAPAHAALAWCYAYPDRTGRGIDDVGPKAKASVARALVLDESLALAHTVAGTIKWKVDYDPEGGEAELRRALALDPNTALVLLPAAEFFLLRGSPDSALPLLERAARLDPFSHDRHVQVGWVLMVGGQYARAVDEFRRALQLNMRYPGAHLWLAETYAYMGDHDQAVFEYLRWIETAVRTDRATAMGAALQRAYAERKWDGFWRAELAWAEADAAQPGAVWAPPYTRYQGAWFMARRYARLGRRDRALDALERSYRERHHLVATLAVDPLFNDLRADPRFLNLLRLTRAPTILFR
jgi:TolB-like protein/DNA-binding winged helix-turn-helix (wHTH) protein